MVAPAGHTLSAEEQEALAEEITTYHAPTELQIAQILEIRQAAKKLILAIFKHCPQSPDRTAALRKVREGMMTANASIVLKGRSIS